MNIGTALSRVQKVFIALEFPYLLSVCLQDHFIVIHKMHYKPYLD